MTTYQIRDKSNYWITFPATGFQIANGGAITTNPADNLTLAAADIVKFYDVEDGHLLQVYTFLGSAVNITPIVKSTQTAAAFSIPINKIAYVRIEEEDIVRDATGAFFGFSVDAGCRVSIIDKPQVT